MITVPRKKIVFSGEALGQRLEVGLARQIGPGNVEGWELGREHENEQKVGKHIGELVPKVGLQGGRG